MLSKNPTKKCVEQRPVFLVLNKPSSQSIVHLCCCAVVWRMCDVVWVNNRCKLRRTSPTSHDMPKMCFIITYIKHSRLERICADIMQGLSTSTRAPNIYTTYFDEPFAKGYTQTKYVLAWFDVLHGVCLYVGLVVWAHLNVVVQTQKESLSTYGRKKLSHV